MQLLEQSAIQYHELILRQSKSQWANVHSITTCLSCLLRRPQYGLPCGHCFCEICIINLAARCKDRWTLVVDYCFLCYENFGQEILIGIRPPTAGVGILCIDGGGARGIIPLVLLKRIYEQIDLPIPIQKYFKLAFGISSGQWEYYHVDLLLTIIGGLIVLHFFLNGGSIEQSIEIFKNLTEVAFRRRKFIEIPYVTKAYDYLISYISDGLYPTSNIENILQDIFTTTKTMIDCSYATSLGTKIGLPVAKISGEPSSIIFTNYNSSSQQGESSKLIKVQD